jgi:hypothetical protein
MSDHQQDRFEMPKAMQSMAEAGFHQARKGFEQFVSGAEQARGSIEERSATVRAGARDVAEAMRLNAEYARTQMRVLAEQTSEMSQIVGRAAIAAARPGRDGGNITG